MQINNINKGLKSYVYKGNYDIENESNNDLLIKKNYFDELFTNVDSGKALIANAFGEPLSKEQSFIDMANNINSLLEIFQSNMRDKNISVSDNEKFEQLIEKIPLITINEDNNNSDESEEIDSLKFAQGEIGASTVAYTGSNYFNSGIALNSNLSFEPDIFLIMIYTDVTISATSHDYINLLDGLVHTSSSSLLNLRYKSSYSNGKAYYSKADDKIYISNSEYEQIEINKIVWYAIGESNGSIEVTATAEDVIEGKTFINSTNQVIEGTMPNQGALSVTPGTTTQSFPGGNYKGISVTGDSELLPENIVQGKNLFGVSGTATAASLGGARISEGIGEVPSDTDLGSAAIETGITNIDLITGFVTILELDVAGIRYKNLTFKLGTEATMISNGYTVKFTPLISSVPGIIVFSVTQNNDQTGIFGDIHYTLLY